VVRTARIRSALRRLGAIVRRLARHGLGRRTDAACVTVATLAAIITALGWTDALPFNVERISIGADIGAGGFALYHAVRHHLRR
jgi:hypothetical protein